MKRKDSFIIHCGIKDGSHKQTLKDKLAQAFKAKEVLEPALPIKRPEPLPELKYYLELSNDKKEARQTYFKALDELQQQNPYDSALIVAKSTVAIYEKLSADVQAIHRHPQPLCDAAAAALDHQLCLSHQPDPCTRTPRE